MASERGEIRGYDGPMEETRMPVHMLYVSADKVSLEVSRVIKQQRQITWCVSATSIAISTIATLVSAAEFSDFILPGSVWRGAFSTFAIVGGLVALYSWIKVLRYGLEVDPEEVSKRIIEQAQIARRRIATEFEVEDAIAMPTKVSTSHKEP